MYIYETHLHTCQGSLCGRSLGREYVKAYQDLGYQGIFITDHFYHGNCAVDRTLPWNAFVDGYCRGYQDAREEGEKQGFQVLFGIEEHFSGDEYLLYGVDAEWLKNYPGMKNCTRAELYREVRAAGGIMIQAHPFRDRDYIKGIHLAVNDSDGIEAVNTANRPGDNLLALAYGKKFGKVLSAGSDIHDVKNVRAGVGAIGFETPLADEKDFAARILRDEGPTLIYDKAFFDGAEADLRLPVEEYKEAGSVPISHQEVLSWLKEVNL